jgi:hypothetical protein
VLNHVVNLHHLPAIHATAGTLEEPMRSITAGCDNDHRGTPVGTMKAALVILMLSQLGGESTIIA